MSNESKFKEAIEALDRKREESGLEKNGKKYSMVKDRVEVFRKYFGSEFGINTDVNYDNGFASGSVLIAVAKITDSTGTVLASGHAMEFVGRDQVTSTSPVEAVETSAIGRALACFGLHGGEYASDFEMTAIPRKENNRPDETPKQSSQINRSGPEVGASIKLYIPKDPHAIYTDLVKELGAVANEISLIKDGNVLTQYWSQLYEFRSALHELEPSLMAELKAAFAVQNHSLNPKGN